MWCSLCGFGVYPILWLRAQAKEPNIVASEARKQLDYLEHVILGHLASRACRIRIAGVGFAVVALFPCLLEPRFGKFVLTAIPRGLGKAAFRKKAPLNLGRAHVCPSMQP